MRQQNFRGALCLYIGLFVALSFISVFPSHAKYPEQAVTLIVPYAAGGPTDVACRTLAEVAKERLGQPVIVSNKPGAASAVAMGALKNSRPDGYTLGATSAGAILSPHLQGANYDFMNDFVHIMQFETHILGLTVRANSPWKNLKELLDQCQKETIVYASTPPGTPNHLSMEQLAYVNRGKVRIVPTQGDAESVNLLLGKNVEAMVTTLMTSSPHIKSGALRCLVLFSEQRIDEFPNIPTAKEMGYDVGTLGDGGFVGIAAPKGTPKDITDRIHEVFKESLKDPKLIQTMGNLFMPVTYRGKEEWVTYLNRWEKEQLEIIKRLGLIKQ